MIEFQQSPYELPTVCSKGGYVYRGVEALLRDTTS